MLTHPCVDHEEVKVCFQTCLEGEESYLITIGGNSGKGKTELLKHFFMCCKNKENIALSLIDFSEVKTLSDARDILGEMRYYLATQIAFDQYTAFLNTTTSAKSGNITIENVSLTDSSIHDLGAGSPQHATDDLRSRTDAFLADMKLFTRNAKVVLLFDTYEWAPSSVRPWFTGTLLPRIADLPNVVVVVCGRETPQVGSARWHNRNKHFNLPLGLEYKYWLEYAEKVGVLHLVEEWRLKRYHKSYQGDPNNMCICCDGLAEGQP